MSEFERAPTSTVEGLVLGEAEASDYVFVRQ